MSSAWTISLFHAFKLSTFTFSIIKSIIKTSMKSLKRCCRGSCASTLSLSQALRKYISLQMLLQRWECINTSSIKVVNNKCLSCLCAPQEILGKPYLTDYAISSIETFLVQVRPRCCEEPDASHCERPWVARSRLHRILWVWGIPVFPSVTLNCFPTQK